MVSIPSVHTSMRRIQDSDKRRQHINNNNINASINEFIISLMFKSNPFDEILLLILLLLCSRSLPLSRLRFQLVCHSLCAALCAVLALQRVLILHTQCVSFTSATYRSNFFLPLYFSLRRKIKNCCGTQHCVFMYSSCSLCETMVSVYL